MINMETVNPEDIRSYDVLLMGESVKGKGVKEEYVSDGNPSSTVSSNPEGPSEVTPEMSPEMSPEMCPEVTSEATPEVTDMEIDKMQIDFIEENHVGNNRFRVMLSMHSSRYNELAQEEKNDEECISIAQKLVNIVCHECEPAGRFLRKVDEKSFVNLGDGDRTIKIVRDLLSKQDETTEIFATEPLNEINQPTTTKECDTSNDTEAITNSAKTINLADRRFSVSGVFKIASRIRMASKSEEPKSQASFSTATTMKSDVTKTTEDDPTETQNDNNDREGHKRSRRPSLLRRSLNITRSFFRADGSRDGHTTHKRYRRISFRRNSKSQLEENEISIVRKVPHSELKEYDVLMTYTPTPSILPTDNIGNNRIRVMMDMQRDKFNEHLTSIPDRQVICNEIYTHTAVGKFSGRFLIKASDNSNAYAEISKENALYVIDWCLDREKPQYHESKSIADSTFKISTTKSMAPFQNTSKKDLSSDDNNVNSLSSNSTAQRRNSFSSSFKEYRSAALKSLRIRKQKKVVLSSLETNKIEELQAYVKVTNSAD